MGLPSDAGSDAQHLGLQSLSFVPSPASSQEGYFYASTGISGAAKKDGLVMANNGESLVDDGL